MLAALEDTLSAGSRAGYREFGELQRRGKDITRRGKWELERGLDRTRVGLSRSVVCGSSGVLGREIIRKPHFLFTDHLDLALEV